MKTKLTAAQIRMLKKAHEYEKSGRPDWGWGYAPVGRGVSQVFQSLARLGLAITTGNEFNPRGIVLTTLGRNTAESI